MPYFHNPVCDLYYRTAGKGKTALILVHGWYQSGQQAFAPLIPKLSGSFRVFVPDLPGHGLTHNMPANFSAAMNEALLIEFVRYVRQRYRCKKIFLAGHSYGAFSSLGVACRIPWELSGIIALSAVDDYAPYHKRLRRVLRIPRFLTPLYYRLQALIGGFPYGDREQLYADAHHELKPGRLAYAKKKTRTLSHSASRLYIQAFLAARVEWPLEKIALPLLLLYGERDKLTPVSWAQRIQPHFKRSIVRVIPGAGHNLQLTAPQAVAEAIRRFVRSGKPHPCGGK